MFLNLNLSEAFIYFHSSSLVLGGLKNVKVIKLRLFSQHEISFLYPENIFRNRKNHDIIMVLLQKGFWSPVKPNYPQVFHADLHES